LLPRVEPRSALRVAVAAARLGGACLALAIVVAAPAPEIVLALLAVVFLLVGGTTVARPGVPAALRWSGPVVAVILARLSAGTGAAMLAALLIGLGALLRITLIEATSGLAVFGVGVAVLGGASPALILAFWLLGAGLLLARRAAGAARTRIARAFLTAERTPDRSLP
jgi:hypothetical protein